MRDLFLALIKTYEIQGSIGLLNSFNRVGFDHVILVKAATAAVVTDLWGGSEKQVADTLSQGFIDTGPLRTYRHAPNTGPRKSWAAGDAASRGVHLALLTMRGEPGYQTPLSAPRWGLQDVLFDGKPLKLEHKLGSYIIENVLFKVAFPAEFHAQTAVEAALQLHPHVKDRLHEIERIDIHTHDAALRIIDKKGPLRNFADRDHCMQYMVATALTHGDLTSDHYSDLAAQDARIDQLRKKMHLKEEKRYSKEYLHPKTRSIASRVAITLKNGTILGPIAVEFPLGHRRRRNEGIPLLWEKCAENLRSRLPRKKADQLIALLQNPDKLESMPVPSFVNLLI
jgi:2-methylcitrate dehydratase